MLQTDEMRRIILIAVFLFITAVVVTAFYFAKLKPSGQNTANVIEQIPEDAALVFEFKNDHEFYDLFRQSSLLTSFIGQKKANELQYLHQHLMKQTAFNNRSIFISLHPGITSGNLDMLMLVNADDVKEAQQTLNALINNSDAAFETETLGNKTIHDITFPALKEAFYLTYNSGVLAGSFNKALLLNFLDERKENKVSNLAQLSDQQNKNSIANLYVNFQRFPVLFKQLFKNQNDDFFRFLAGFPASAALSLNYKTDALLFNGFTQTDTSAATYLNLFLNQQPVKNTLKNIYPLNTASAIGFAYGNPNSFLKGFDGWQNQTHQFAKAKALFNQIKQETGVSIKTAFQKQLDKEFAIVTTSNNDEIALISVKNGSELEPFLRNISENPDSEKTRFKYQNLPYYLLGQPFSNFKQPYFVLIDNYLFLSDSESALERYLQNYRQQHFLGEDQQYYDFNQLLAGQSNVSFFIQLPNSFKILKNNMQPGFRKTFGEEGSGWNDYYAAALQFTASENKFYTNFCLKQKKQETGKSGSTALQKPKT